MLMPREIAITPMDESFLNKMKAVVEEHLGDEDFEVESLGQEIGMSRSQIHRKLKDGSGYNLLVQHLLNLKNSTTGVPVEDPQLPAMIDNWIRLGLVEVSYDKHLTDAVLYSWADQRPEFLRLSQEPQPDGAKVECQKGIMQRTELGRRFARAIGLQ